MKKLISLLLVFTCLFGSGCVAMADEDDSGFNQETFDAFVECFELFCKEYFAEKENEDEIDVNGLTSELSTLSPEDAYIAYAKTCITLIVGASNGGYDVITSLNDYSPIELGKSIVLAKDLYELDLTGINRNKDGSRYDDLVEARSGYLNLQENIALLDLVMQSAVEVPEKYMRINGYINTAKDKLDELLVLLTNFCNGTDKRSAFEVWSAAEDLYWHGSILSLQAIFYTDTMCG